LKIKHSSLFPFLVLLLAALGCNSLTGDSGSTGNTSSTTTTTTAANTTSSSGAASTADIAGTYDITGTNEGGGGAYSGTLIVANRGDVHQFKWDTAGKKYDGVGVRTGSGVGVAFAEGDDGRGCGVVLYRIGADGSLDGKAGYWGVNTSETETATRTKGTDLEGDYSVKGRNTDGKDYSGTLVVKKSGAGYEFVWNTGSPLSGFGIRQGDSVAVGIGGQKCGFVSYEVKGDGTLDGKWGGYGSTSVGTEVAKKR
jgi:hypothetical protein